MFWVLTRSSRCLSRTPLARHASRNRRWLSQDSKKFNILFMGRDEFSCGVFQELYAVPDVWNYITIATHPDEKVGRRGSLLSVSPLKILGSSLGVPVHTIPPEKKDFRYWTLPPPFALSDDTPPPASNLLVTASFGRILPLSMLSQFPKAQRLNIHPSLLPAYRGPAPIQHALMRGEKEVGVCVIRMLPVKKKGGNGGGIDAGDIWGCRKMDVPEGVDFIEMRGALAKEGGRLLVNVLRDMIEGTAKAVPQHEDTDAPHAPMITKADWTLDFAQLTAEEIVWRHHAISHQRHLTALIPTSPVKTVQFVTLSASTDPDFYRGLSTTPGSASLHKSRGLLVRCKGGSVLEVYRVKQEGKKEVSAKEWWNGVKGMGIMVDPELAFKS